MADCTHHRNPLPTVLVKHVLGGVDAVGPRFAVAQPQVERGFVKVDLGCFRSNHFGQLHCEVFSGVVTPRQRLRVLVAHDKILDAIADVELLQALLGD